MESIVSTSQKPMIVLENHLEKISQEDLIRGIIKGLTARPKQISSRWFYDARGSKLFEEITRLPEYYPTRTEKSLIVKMAKKIASDWQGGSIIELGSGDPSKIHLLLAQLSQTQIQDTHYVPVDVSESAIRESATFLQNNYPEMKITGQIADFIHHIHLFPRTERGLYCFFGSTLGNLTREDARLFIQKLSAEMQDGDLFLLGVDRVKDIDVLEKAYNDNAGVTAEFNKNCLQVINSVLKSDFDPSQFRHVAFYNTAEKRIEMHLEALRETTVHSPYFDKPLQINKGERIHTENSHKFDEHHLQDLQKVGGLQKKSHLQDEKHYFSLLLFEKQSIQS